MRSLTFFVELHCIFFQGLAADILRFPFHFACRPLDMRHSGQPREAFCHYPGGDDATNPS